MIVVSDGTAVNCPNRLTIRAKVADNALLAGLQAELRRPETIEYISSRLTTALNAVIDQRPRQKEDLDRAKTVAEQKLKNLVSAVEEGAGSASIFQAMQNREAEIRALDAQRAALEEPLQQRLAVIPRWVKQELDDVAGLLAEAPERAKTEFQRLGIRFTVHPVYDEGQRPFLRAEGEGNFDHLAFSQHSPLTTTDRSPLRSTGSRKFVVDLPVISTEPSAGGGPAEEAARGRLLSLRRDHEIRRLRRRRAAV